MQFSLLKENHHFGKSYTHGKGIAPVDSWSLFLLTISFITDSNYY